MHDPDESPLDESSPKLPRSERPSKTQRKKEMHDLQSLGENLVLLPESRLAHIDMPESLRDAVEQFKNTRSFEGKRRQMQYIGKLMRKVDAEALALAIDRDEIAHRQPELAAPKPQREWAQKLLAEDGGAEALQDLIAEQPSADVQQLRSLIRQTKKLQTSAKALQNTQPPVPDKAYAEHQAAKRALKKLERYLAGVLGAEGDSDDEGDGGEDEA